MAATISNKKGTHAAKTSTKSPGVRQDSPAPPSVRVAILGKSAPDARPVKELMKTKSFCSFKELDLKALDDAAPASAFDVAILADDSDATGRTFDERFSKPDALRFGVIALTDSPLRYSDAGPGWICLPPDCSPDMLRGAILALQQNQPKIAAYARQLQGMHRLHASLHRHFDAIDHELQLASRLQRDFMPKDAPTDGPIRFTTFFRPCSWVSGDIFDIFRLDESRYGFYLADAVGHGVSAGLLTMYIKHAIKPKRDTGGGEEIVPPSQVLAALNDQLTAQKLPDSQFITFWYGIIDRDTLRLDYAIAGHPPPLVVDSTGIIAELAGDGGLLGLSAGETFSDEAVTLTVGQRVILYSDGIESHLIDERLPSPAPPRTCPQTAALLAAGPERLCARVTELLDTQPGGLTHSDDATMVLLDALAG